MSETETGTANAEIIAATDKVANEFIERLRARVPLVEKITTSAGDYYMRKPTGKDRWRMLLLQQAMMKAGNESSPPALLVAASLINPDGTHLFDDLSVGYEFIDSLDNHLINELFDEMLRVTGLGPKSAEDAEKKS